MRTIEGKLDASEGRWAIIVSRWNSFITERLTEGAVDALLRHGADDENITLVRVPGAFEVPLAAQQLAATGKVDGIVALGCVIRGATPHFEYVSNEVAKGIARASLDASIPITFGVLTTDTIEQAVERAGTKSGNKGAEAALAAIEMVNLMDAVAHVESNLG